MHGLCSTNQPSVTWHTFFYTCICGITLQQIQTQQPKAVHLINTLKHHYTHTSSKRKFWYEVMDVDPKFHIQRLIVLHTPHHNRVTHRASEGTIITRFQHLYDTQSHTTVCINSNNYVQRHKEDKTVQYDFSKKCTHKHTHTYKNHARHTKARPYGTRLPFIIIPICDLQ